MIRITKKQWEFIFPIVQEIRPKKIHARKAVKNSVEGILWVISANCAWSDMPRRFSAPATCFKLYKDLLESGHWDRILLTLAIDLKKSAKIDILACFNDGKFNEDCGQIKLYRLLKKFNKERDWRFYTLFLFLNPYATEKRNSAKQLTLNGTMLPRNKKIGKIKFVSFNQKVDAIYSERTAAP